MNDNDRNRARDQINLGTYVAAVGAAFVTTFFDHVRNREASAMRKTGVAIRELVDWTTVATYGPSATAILMFCAVAALLVFVYRPKELKESFLLGLSVLAAVGMTVPPVERTGVQASRTEAAPKLGILNLLPISTANAQAQQYPSRSERMVWIFLEGPKQHQMPETNVMVYSRGGGNLVINALVNTVFYMTVPDGKYQVEISHLGYRGASFVIDANLPVTAYRVPMRAVSSDSISNFFGPASAIATEDPSLTQLLERAISECARRNDEVAAALARQIGVPKEKLSRESRRLLCI